MRYFIDFEFIEDGKTIDPLSIGIVAEDGREYYAEFRDADWNKASDFVWEHVLPRMTLTQKKRKSRDQVKLDVVVFVSGYPEPEFWGYYADYDWVAFCQIFGTMLDLPKGWPMYCRDIKQLADELGNPKLPEHEDEHHALSDARWNFRAWQFLRDYKP